MTKDLEQTLAELGPGYREVVDRVVGAYAAPKARRTGGLVGSEGGRRGRIVGWSAMYLAAASLLVFLGLGVFFREPTVRGTSDSRLAYTVAYAPDEAALSAILSSQHPDGSWDNDFITRQNAAALRNAAGADRRIAYKKAVRYLKSRGLRPLSDDELKVRGDEAARLLSARSAS